MKEKRIEVDDCESYPRYYSSVWIDYRTDETKVFEIYEKKNDLEELKKHIKQIDYAITFNGVHYDDLITNFILNSKEKDGLRLAMQINELSNNIIGSEHDETKYDKIKKWKYNIPYQQIDLFLYWSKMLRLSKKLSLKSLEANMLLDIVECEIPFDQQILTDEEIEIIKGYNFHDTKCTKELAVRMKPDINLRFKIGKDYDLKGALIMDAPKLASEILLDDYCKSTWNQEGSFEDYKKEVRKYRVDRPKIPLKEVLPEVKFKTPKFQQLYENYQKAVDTHSEEVLIRDKDNNPLLLQFAIGGLHSKNDNESYDADNVNYLISSDVASLYPTLIYNMKLVPKRFGDKFLEVYRKIYLDRLEAKRTKDKNKDKLLKLVLNSFSGLLDNTYAWFYDPHSALKLRITGQLLLARVIEEATLAGFRVVSANTK